MIFDLLSEPLPSAAWTFPHPMAYKQKEREIS